RDRPAPGGAVRGVREADEQIALLVLEQLHEGRELLAVRALLQRHLFGDFRLSECRGDHERTLARNAARLRAKIVPWKSTTSSSGTGRTPRSSSSGARRRPRSSARTTRWSPAGTAFTTRTRSCLILRPTSCGWRIRSRPCRPRIACAWASA